MNKKATWRLAAFVLLLAALACTCNLSSLTGASDTNGLDETAEDAVEDAIEPTVEEVTEEPTEQIVEEPTETPLPTPTDWM